MNGNTWHESVPNAGEFDLERQQNLDKLSMNQNHRQSGLNLLLEVGKNGFGHKNSWMGVPIIRLPEDLILQQEIVWREKPDLVIEIGIARGGGLIYNASLQEMCGIQPNVIGVDNKIFPHTLIALNQNRFAKSLKLFEGDSTSSAIVEDIAKISAMHAKVLLILDSDHSSTHVLKELRNYVPILPVGSVIMVCDTLIDEYPAGTYPDRSWSDGNGPLHAMNLFMNESKSVERFMETETRALVLSEIRDGLLRKVFN